MRYAMDLLELVIGAALIPSLFWGMSLYLNYVR